MSPVNIRCPLISLQHYDLGVILGVPLLSRCYVPGMVGCIACMGFSVFEIAKNNNYNKLLIEKYLQNKGLSALYLARKTTPDMIKEK